MAEILIGIGRNSTLISYKSIKRALKKAKGHIEEAEQIFDQKTVDYDKLKYLLIDAILALGNILESAQFRRK